MSLTELFCHVDDFCQQAEPEWEAGLLTDGTGQRWRPRDRPFSTSVPSHPPPPRATMEQIPLYSGQGGVLKLPNVVVLVHNEGETIAIVSAYANQVRPIREGEIAHVRTLESA